MLRSTLSQVLATFASYRWSGKLALDHCIVEVGADIAGLEIEPMRTCESGSSIG